MPQNVKSLKQPTDPRRTQELSQLCDELERFAARFAYPAQRDVRRLMRSSARLADLATVFPGAIHALATKRGPAEARAMQNGADQYAEHLADDKCRLFSVRRDSEHIASLEIGPHSREAGMLAITQLKGRHNMAAPLNVWQAAYAWLAGQNGLRRLPPRIPPERRLDTATWRQLMLPYRRRKDGAPWLPSTATHDVFDSFNMEMSDLARRGGVSSWLFT